MYSLPTTVESNNHQFKITNNGDYRMVVDCFIALNDAELDDDKLRVITALLIFYEDFKTPEQVIDYLDENGFDVVNQMYRFFNCNMDSIGANTRHRVIDWEKDGQMICSAVNKVANKEIRFEPYMHWWTFMGYFNAVGESVLSTVVSIRDKISRHKKLESYEKDFKKDNPQYFNIDFRSAEERRAEEEFMKNWHTNKK